ncbi:MAG TPA: 4'-phosphopantetheinyl transferase superfamily protein [Armatimonadota bacterium]|nr:4'-phosphopantetheinyl transferase superfamily protein [Armatimonadota bacterium]
MSDPRDAPTVPLSYPALLENEVHVWRAPLADVGAVPDVWRQSLSDDERERAGRFRFARDRERFTYCRSVLRLLLGSYLGLRAGDVPLSYGSSGKPAVAGDGVADGLRFNLSHCKDLALFAFARGRDLGIDIERLRGDIAVMEIAGRFFSPRERAHLLALPEHLRTPSFFWGWVRKEAYIKALGEGLHIPLDGFDVSMEPSPSASAVPLPDGEGHVWLTLDLDLGPHHAAALVVEGSGWKIRYLDWPPDEA